MQINGGYGSDQSGIICAYLFTADKPCREINSEDALTWIQATSKPAHTFLWLHFNLSNTASERWLNKHQQLPSAFYEALHEGSRTTRIEHVDDVLLGVVNDVLYDFSFDPSEISTLWVLVNTQLIISARSKPLLSIDRLRESVKKGEMFRSPVELLIHLLRDQADVLLRIVRHATNKVDVIEDGLHAKNLPANRTELSRLRRVLVRLERLLALEPAAMFRFLHKPPLWINEVDLTEFRHSTEEFALALEDMRALLERIKLLQEEVAAEVNEKTSHTLFVLTMVTVLVLPINIIAGLFGMNVGGIPLANDEQGFEAVVILIILFTAAASMWIWRVIKSRRG